MIPATRAIRWRGRVYEVFCRLENSAGILLIPGVAPFFRHLTTNPCARTSVEAGSSRVPQSCARAVCMCLLACLHDVHVCVLAVTVPY